MDYQSFIHHLSELFIFEDDAVNDEDLITWIMSIGEPSLYSIQLMKERGNSLFKKGNISLAGGLYKMSLNLLCYVSLLPSCDQCLTSTIGLSLVLNLAACELKLSHYDLAIRYCKFVLHFDPVNVKAFYRRGLAYKELKLLKDAPVDFEQVLHLDPNNSEAGRELLIVVEKLAVKSNGKRVAFPFDPLGSDRIGKKPLLGGDGANESIVASCSSSCSTEPILSQVSSGQDLMDFDSICTSNPHPVAENDHDTPYFFSEKPATHSFSNKKRAFNKLHISSQDYDNLLLGKDLSFFHAGSLSFMRVRPFIPEKSIQTGTPHEDISRAAEVPPTSPLFKEPLEHSTYIINNEKSVQEEVVFQIEKKKRILSDSAQVSHQVSQVSAVQYQFSAARGRHHKCCRRKLDYSYLRSQDTQASVCLKKRSSISVDFSHFLCWFNKKDAVTIMAKRKGADLIHFDDFFHPPYTKCRLTLSISVSCSFRSVRWLSSSLQDSGTPGFVM